MPRSGTKKENDAMQMKRIPAKEPTAAEQTASQHRLATAWLAADGTGALAHWQRARATHAEQAQYPWYTQTRLAEALTAGYATLDVRSQPTAEHPQGRPISISQSTVSRTLAVYAYCVTEFGPLGLDDEPADGSVRRLRSITPGDFATISALASNRDVKPDSATPVTRRKSIPWTEHLSRALGAAGVQTDADTAAAVTVLDAVAKGLITSMPHANLAEAWLTVAEHIDPAILSPA